MLGFIETWNDVLFPGFTVTVAGVAGVLVGWKRSGRFRELVFVYTGLAAVACWMSFGPNAGLYSVMYTLIPLFEWMRAPARFGVIVVLALAVLGGVAMRDWLDRVQHPMPIVGAVAIVAVAMLATPLRFREIPPTPPAYRLLSMLPAGPVIELPFFAPRGDLHAHAGYVLASTTHWMPLINGYSDYIPASFVDSAEALSTFPSRAAFSVLAAAPPRYAVFHLNLFAHPQEVLARLREFAAILKPLYTDGDIHVYEIVALPPHVVADGSCP